MFFSPYYWIDSFSICTQICILPSFQIFSACTLSLSLSIDWAIWGLLLYTEDAYWVIFSLFDALNNFYVHCYILTHIHIHILIYIIQLYFLWASIHLLSIVGISISPSAHLISIFFSFQAMAFQWIFFLFSLLFCILFVCCFVDVCSMRARFQEVDWFALHRNRLNKNKKEGKRLCTSLIDTYSIEKMSCEYIKWISSIKYE